MRQQNAAYYDEKLKDIDVRTPFVAYQRNCHIYNQYVISVPENRDGLRQFLADNDVNTEIYYPVSFHMQACFKDLGYREGLRQQNKP